MDAHCTINNWQELVELEAQFDAEDDEWVFRGHSSINYNLVPTIERAFTDLNIDEMYRYVIEAAVIADFKRSARLYSPHIALKDEDTLGWLALMRHYGTPSRLLDFSYSLFIASYFALEYALKDPCVWAVNKTWLGEHLLRILEESEDPEQANKDWAKRESCIVEKILMQAEPDKICVATVNPMALNDRLVVQQGLFLCASDVTKSFHDLLLSIDDSDKSVKRIDITSSAREEILLRLIRTGINRAALFPDFEGFANSLRIKMLLYKSMKDRRARGGRKGETAIGV